MVFNGEQKTVDRYFFTGKRFCDLDFKPITLKT